MGQSRRGNVTRGHYTRTPDEVLRDARAVELRRAHLTYDQIARELGYQTRSAAYYAVQRGLGDSVLEANDEVRQMEVERLDELSRRALRVVATPHYRIHNGELIKHPETEEYLLDHAPVLKAIETLIKLSERKSHLLGLDAVKRVEVLTPGMIDEEIARLSAEISRRATEGA